MLLFSACGDAGGSAGVDVGVDATVDATASLDIVAPSLDAEADDVADVAAGSPDATEPDAGHTLDASDAGALDVVDGAAAETVDTPPWCATYLDPVAVGTLPDSLTEASGLVVSALEPGRLWLHNDSGDGPNLFAVSTEGALPGAHA